MFFYLILLKDVNLFVGSEVEVSLNGLIVFKAVKRSILVHSQLCIPHYIMPVLMGHAVLHSFMKNMSVSGADYYY